MKKIILLLQFCFSFSAFSQTIVYDYTNESGSPFSAVKLKNGSTVRLKIENINNVAHKVSIDTKLYVLDTPIPEEFRTLFRITEASSEKSIQKTEDQTNAMKDVATDVKNKIGSKLDGDNTMTSKLDSIMKSLGQSCEDYLIQTFKIKNALTVKLLIHEALTDKSLNSVDDMSKRLGALGINEGSIDEINNNFEKFERQYKETKAYYDLAENTAIEAKDEINLEKIKAAKKNIIEEYANLEKIYEEALGTIQSEFRLANEVSTYSVISDPVFLKNVDELDFEVKIGGHDSDLSTVQPFIPSFNVAGGIKLDYSVGPVFNFQTDDVYYLDSGKKLQKNETKNSFTPGLAAMLHLTRRKTEDVSFGGMLGINAGFKEVTDVNLGFLSGVSLILGRERKIFVSTGVSFFKISRLKEKQFNLTSTYTDADLPNVTTKVLKPSFFLSVSLSIAQRVNR